MQRVGLLARVDDERSLQLERLQSSMRGPRELGRRRSLELEALPAPASDPEEIELRAGVGRPEEALLGNGSQALEDLTHQEPLPRGAELRMPLEIPAVPNVKESVEQPCIADVDLRCLDLSLADRCVPRL